jgi:hypothetical protein
MTAAALVALVIGCQAQSGRTAPQGQPIRMGAGPQALFDPRAPLIKGQEVHVTGRIEYHDPDEDLDADNAYARLNVANGDFDIVLDARGQEMVKQMDGRLVNVRAVLTGEYSSDMSMSVSNGLRGRISKVTRVPEIRVTDFKYVGPPAQDAMVDNGDGTVLDKLAGLQWQSADDGTKGHWDEAVAYAKSLTLAGHADWRLPSVSELQLLWKKAGRKKSLRASLFPSIKPDVYWSSTVQEDPDWVGAMSFNPLEHVGGEWKQDFHYVLCVRQRK